MFFMHVYKLSSCISCVLFILISIYFVVTFSKIFTSVPNYTLTLGGNIYVR